MHVISTRFDWNCSTTQARILYLPGGQSTKWVVEWKNFLCKLQNEWLNNKMFSHLRAQVASRYTLPTAADVFCLFLFFSRKGKEMTYFKAISLCCWWMMIITCSSKISCFSFRSVTGLFWEVNWYRTLKAWRHV